MQFIPAIKISDLPIGAKKPVMVGGKELILLNVDGAIHAVQRRCPHMGADLCKAKMEAGLLICPKHRATFDIVTGEVMARAKLMFMFMKTGPLQTYNTKLDGGTILVEIE